MGGFFLQRSLFALYFVEHPYPRAMTTAFVSIDARITELARKAISNSGQHFYGVVLRRTQAFLEDFVADSIEVEDLEAAAATLTSDDLVLLARYYAGEVVKATKKHRRSKTTLADKVDGLLANRPSRLILQSMFIASFLNVALEEIDKRCLAAERSTYWKDELANQDRHEMWMDRAGAVDGVIPGWEVVAEKAKEEDWEGFVEALDELEEIDV